MWRYGKQEVEVEVVEAGVDGEHHQSPGTSAWEESEGQPESFLESADKNPGKVSQRIHTSSWKDLNLTEKTVKKSSAFCISGSREIRNDNII